jgi:hypothetical protein
VSKFATLNLIKTPKNSGENAKGVPRKSDLPLQGQRALRGFSSSPRKKDFCEKEAPSKSTGYFDCLASNFQ